MLKNIYTENGVKMPFFSLCSLWFNFTTEDTKEAQSSQQRKRPICPCPAAFRSQSHRFQNLVPEYRLLADGNWVEVVPYQVFIDLGKFATQFGGVYHDAFDFLTTQKFVCFVPVRTGDERTVLVNANRIYQADKFD